MGHADRIDAEPRADILADDAEGRLTLRRHLIEDQVGHRTADFLHREVPLGRQIDVRAHRAGDFGVAGKESARFLRADLAQGARQIGRVLAQDLSPFHRAGLPHRPGRGRSRIG
jgi:hypothetical protein